MLQYTQQILHEHTLRCDETEETIHMSAEIIKKAIDKHASRIYAAEQFIWSHPETGYREVETTAYLAEQFRELGYPVTLAEGITGFYTVIDTGRPGATILVMGEMDAVLCPSHPAAHPLTGAVHACGHHAQCAGLVGIAAALSEPEVLAQMSGKIILAAVPAEELLEIEYRDRLRKEGVIKYYGGKPEFLSRGYFDNVDMAFMVHTSVLEGIGLTHGSVGCRTKRVIYKGRAAHAGSSPHLGRNALYAATCGINAVNAIRETFRECDMIRVHPIITHGGDMVNAIPECVELESYVRGSSFDAIDNANRKVNQALIGAALSVGTNIEIIDAPGYAPFLPCEELLTVAEEAAKRILPEQPIRHGGMGAGSTDNGDLSAIMPVIQPYCGGAKGKAHGSDYTICDPELACLGAAKLQVMLLCLLSENNGERAMRIKEGYVPRFASKEAYLAYLDSTHTSGDRITYAKDGTATIRLS